MTINENITRFCLSGMSSMSAGFITNPVDVIKVRLQLDNELSHKKNIFADRYYKGFVRGAVAIVRDEGIAGLYKGVGASVLREGVYSTIRIGAYEPFKEFLGAEDPRRAPLWKKVIAGGTAGAIGSTIANPTDLIKIRMQGQGKLKPGEQKRYRNVLVAFREIAIAEGVVGLWRGVVPTVQRATLLTAAQVPSYDHTKHTMLNRAFMREGIALHAVSSLIAGFVTALVTSPVDVIKTRVMNQRVIAGQAALYKSTTDCFVKIFQAEGVLGFYKGFIPNWLRIGPHTIITFMIFEQLRKLVGMRPI